MVTDCGAFPAELIVPPETLERNKSLEKIVRTERNSRWRIISDELREFARCENVIGEGLELNQMDSDGFR